MTENNKNIYMQWNMFILIIYIHKNKKNIRNENEINIIIIIKEHTCMLYFKNCFKK